MVSKIHVGNLLWLNFCKNNDENLPLRIFLGIIIMVPDADGPVQWSLCSH